MINMVILPPGARTIAGMGSAEYLCGYFGNWHLGDDVIAQHGFDAWVSTEDGHRAEYTKRGYRYRFSDYQNHLIANGFKPGVDTHGERLFGGDRVAGAPVFTANQRATFPAEYQMASFLGNRAAGFIEENKDRPFVLYVSTFEPHSPYIGVLQELYDPSQLPVGPAFLKKPDGASFLNRARADFYLQYLSGNGNQHDDHYMEKYAATGEDVSTEEG